MSKWFTRRYNKEYEKEGKGELGEKEEGLDQ